MPNPLPQMSLLITTPERRIREFPIADGPPRMPRRRTDTHLDFAFNGDAEDSDYYTTPSPSPELTQADFVQAFEESVQMLMQMPSRDTFVVRSERPEEVIYLLRKTQSAMEGLVNIMIENSELVGWRMKIQVDSTDGLANEAIKTLLEGLGLLLDF